LTSSSQCQSGEVVRTLKKYLKFTRDLEGYVTITTEAANQMMGPNAALSDWINSFVQQQQQQSNWKDVYVKTVHITFAQNLALLRKVITFRQEPLKPEAKLLLDKIRESEKTKSAIAN
jgi:hypothetical protein